MAEKKRCFDGRACEHALNGLPDCPRGWCSLESLIEKQKSFRFLQDAVAIGNLASVRIFNRLKGAPPKNLSRSTRNALEARLKGL
jgi:hypothetical protein